MTALAVLRAFLMDDEPLALTRLARMLEATGRVEIVGRATDPERGLVQVAAATVDVIFLDIHMPGLTGFQVVERLAALLRFALDATQEGVIPLGQEIKIVVDYLEIEHTRLGERLAYAVKVDPAVEACAIPPLAVQTLVENSIKHAIAPRPHGGHVRVDASQDGDHVVLSVWDDGPGFGAGDIRPGHGLENLQARLTARFGDAARLAIERSAGGTLVTVCLPRPQ